MRAISKIVGVLLISFVLFFVLPAPSKTGIQMSYAGETVAAPQLEQGIPWNTLATMLLVIIMLLLVAFACMKMVDGFSPDDPRRHRRI